MDKAQRPIQSAIHNKSFRQTHSDPYAPQRASELKQYMVMHRPPKALVPLPLTTPVQINIHPILCYSPIPTIIYDLNLPLETATLATKAMFGTAKECFLQPAVDPDVVDSLTIRIEGIERPVVIVASTLDRVDPYRPSKGIITIWDVLYHSHLAWKQAKQEHMDDLSHLGTEFMDVYPPPFESLLFSPVEGRSDGPSEMRSTDHSTDKGHSHDHQLELFNRDRMSGVNNFITGDVVAQPGLDHFSFEHGFFWSGLVPSKNEHEVWTMQPTQFY